MEKRRGVQLGLLLGLTISLLVVIAGCLPTEGATDQQGGLSGSLPMIIFVVVIIALMYFMMMRPQRKQQKERQAMMAQLKRGDKVITSAGIFGEIDGLSEDTILLKLESGATMRVTRSSVVGKRSQGTTDQAK